MKLDPNISLEDFRAEMQHRVVRYSPQSLVVRHALRFAREHENPEFYRIAVNKIHAQRQFQRELHGPSFLERVFDYFSLGSLREVVVTVLLVGLGVVGIDAGRKAIQRLGPATPYDSMDVNQLAGRLGFLLEDAESSHGSTRDGIRRVELGQEGSRRVNLQTESSEISGLTDRDVERIVRALVVALKNDRVAELQRAGAANGLEPAKELLAMEVGSDSSAVDATTNLERDKLAAKSLPEDTAAVNSRYSGSTSNNDEPENDEPQNAEPEDADFENVEAGNDRPASVKPEVSKVYNNL